MRPLFRVSVTAAALCLTPALALQAPAATAEELVNAVNPERLVNSIRELGYRAELETDDVGDPLIKSSVGGTRFAIVFYGCDEHRHDDCDFLLFKVGYDMQEEVALEVINRWNATQLVGRAYRDDVNDPWLEMAWNLQGGVSAANFESTFEWWEVSVGQFEDHIGF